MRVCRLLFCKVTGSNKIDFIPIKELILIGLEKFNVADPFRRRNIFKYKCSVIKNMHGYFLEPGAFFIGAGYPNNR